MDLQFFAEKTETPTPKRREDARRKGQVARSPELGSAALLLGLSLGFRLLGPGLVQRLWQLGNGFWSLKPGEVTLEGIPHMAQTVVYTYAMIVIPVFAVAMAVGASAGVAQGGFLFTPVPLKPDFNRLNPLGGLKKILSKKALVELVKSMIKTVALGSVSYLTIKAELSSILSLHEVALMTAVSKVADIAYAVLWRCGLVLLVVAVGDYVFQRWEHERSLFMSRQEVKEEMKQVEGRPEVRSRIREKQRAIARMRMMAQVPRADVVVTNPQHYAVALRYDALRMAAPQVVAKGEGLMAQRIRKEAEKHKVAIVRNVALAQGLYRSVQIGDYVPAEFYKAVAEVLAFVYRLRGKV